MEDDVVSIRQDEFGNAFVHKLQHADAILKQLTRIADAQEGMLAIAAEARVERLELAKKMKQHFTTGFQGGPNGSGGNQNKE